MLLENFNFALPKDLIANAPVEPRDYAELLSYNRQKDQATWGHFFDLPNYLNENDLLVFNNSKVIPARLIFELNGKMVEIFLLEKVGLNWKALVRPGKRFLVGSEINLHGVNMKVMAIDADGLRHFRISADESNLAEFLDKFGEMPVPPYITQRNYHAADYNTVYSTKNGSVAAPTAGLHFTNQLLSRLQDRGVSMEFVTLHVGLGTFLPVKAADSRFHKMHEEKYEIDYRSADRLNRHIANGKRIIAVGTTSVRVLEDNFGKFGEIRGGKFSTNIFIKPGYDWKVINGLITNFHLPKSTLLMLVAALIGKEKLLELYQQAINRKMRFFSFGDGMLIL